MNLKELIKEVEKYNECYLPENRLWYKGTKQTVEAVDNSFIVEDKWSIKREEILKDWQKLKKLLGVK